MADPVTTDRGYAVPTHGSNVDTWDEPLNRNFQLINNNFGAVANVALSNANVTLNAAQYACGTIRFTGTLTANVIVTMPAIQAWYTIDNRTTGNFYVILVTGGAGENIAIPQGQISDIAIDATNIRFRSLMLPGSYWDYAGTSVPGWVSACTVPPFLNCNGSTYNTSTYPILAQILGTNVLPDARGRSRFALDQGTGRVTTGGSGINGSGVGSVGGAQNTLITTSYLPATQIPVNGTVTSVSTATFLQANSTGGATITTGAISIQVLNNATQAIPVTSSSAIGGGSVNLLTDGLGSGNSMPIMPPTYMGGITMIRAA